MAQRNQSFAVIYQLPLLLGKTVTDFLLLGLHSCNDVLFTRPVNIIGVPVMLTRTEHARTRTKPTRTRTRTRLARTRT